MLWLPVFCMKDGVRSGNCCFQSKNYASPLQPAFQNTNAKHFYHMASSLQVFAVKLMTSMQTVGDCGKLLAITTIPERILVQKCIMHCGQFQTSNCSNLQKTTTLFTVCLVVARWTLTGLSLCEGDLTCTLLMATEGSSSVEFCDYKISLLT